MKTIALLLTLCLACGPALGLGPHEVLLLVNETSADSVKVADAFARYRNVPDRNVVRVSLPVTGSGGAGAISVEEFGRLIWAPAMEQVRARGLEEQVLAWVYSTAFPFRVTTRPPMSINGLTFLRGRLPDMGEVGKGTFASPLFAGPHQPGALGHYSQTFDVQKLWLGDDMPLPSMVLGYDGPRGNRTEEVLRCLAVGAQSDALAPTGTVYFVRSADIRSRCRQWQFPLAARELRKLGVRAVIGDELPVARPDVLGVMMGAPNVDPVRIGRFLPGAMAEHLTSAAAVFEGANQTKLSAWIKAGATASAGTVTEPYAIWTKFPHARFYVHYASGCTMIESFYQAIRCPLQILLVGDPLAQPWAPRGKVRVVGLGEESVSGVLVLDATVESDPSVFFGKLLFLVDGVPLGEGTPQRLDTDRLTEGRHVLRVVAYRTGLVRAQMFLDQPFTVTRPSLGSGRDALSAPRTAGAGREP